MTTELPTPAASWLSYGGKRRLAFHGLPVTPSGALVPVRLQIVSGGPTGVALPGNPFGVVAAEMVVTDLPAEVFAFSSSTRSAGLATRWRCEGIPMEGRP